jgi:hypothetical protein
MKLLEENGKMYGYEITPKVKAITAGEYYRGCFVSGFINWRQKEF